MNGLWDLERDPVTWDFAAYLVCAKTLGITHVNFKSKTIAKGKFHGAKAPAEVIAKGRFENILKPLCDLAGVTHSEGEDGLKHGFHAGNVNRVFEERGWIWKFKPLTDHGKRGYVTVTIRESFRNINRNSNRKEWDRVIAEIAKENEVIVLEDCERDKTSKPMPVSERMSLYAYADMNLGASNGPLALLMFSDAPYLVFNIIPRNDNERIWEKHMSNGGFPKGTQFKFRNKNQRIVWEHDDYETIMREYRA